MCCSNSFECSSTPNMLSQYVNLGTCTTYLIFKFNFFYNLKFSEGRADGQICCWYENMYKKLWHLELNWKILKYGQWKTYHLIEVYGIGIWYMVLEEHFAQNKIFLFLKLREIENNLNQWLCRCQPHIQLSLINKIILSLIIYSCILTISNLWKDIY